MRVEDHPHRAPAGTVAHRQPRVVRDGGARTDHHRVREGAQAVQMLPVLRAGDEVGVTGPARDEAVQALPQLREDHPGTGQAERQIPLGERLGFRGGVPPPVPAVRLPQQPGGPGVRRRPDTAQPFPGRRRTEHPGRPAPGPGGHAGLRPEPGRRAPPGAAAVSWCAPAAGSGTRSEKYAAKESASPASNSFPFAAVARDGHPTTPDSV